MTMIMSLFSYFSLHCHPAARISLPRLVEQKAGDVVILRLGIVTSIENNAKVVEKGKVGDQVCSKIEDLNNGTPLYGRQFTDETKGLLGPEGGLACSQVRADQTSSSSLPCLLYFY